LTFPNRRFLALGAALGLTLASVGGAAAAGSHAPREVMMPPRGAAGHAKPVRSSNLSFHGGNPGVVKGLDKVYLVLWGSQWNSNDPSGERAILESFFSKVGGSSWNNSVTQYCDGVAVGTTTCAASATHATNPAGVFGGTFIDNASAAPSSPTQSQLAAEAIRAAANFHVTTAQGNREVQYVIATATGNNASGAGSQYCAWHSSTSSAYGTLAYTNLPYITDFGASCGANFNNLGPNAGITIVEGHEFAETETDIFPNGGWLDSRGAENGDKCAWISSGQGASASVSLNGTSFPVQSLWSNAFNNGAGGCVNSY
jgi:serine protease